MATENVLAWIHWDPNPYVFVIPYINRPLTWYGLFFVSGFIASFFILLPFLRQKLTLSRKTASPEEINELSYGYLDQLIWFIIIGTIIGARLGHVFFYDWPRYKDNLIDIPKIWEGGLASHGGVIGVLLAIFCYVKWNQKKYPEMTFLSLCDLLAIPAALIATFIRLGNFINQEILGTTTTVPWAIVFGHPADGGPALPRHPAQLYEAGAYLVIFIILLSLKIRKGETLPLGFLTGLMFFLIFSFRFFIEFVKAPQSMMMDESLFQMGQLLSIPFIILGLGLMFLTKMQQFPLKK